MAISFFSDTSLVIIRCITYNHAPYIRQCLEGFVMQKTNFRFEAIVHDDASTDGTADIIREYAEKYPDIIKPIYETENQYSKHDGSIRRIIDAAMASTAKYVAWCEGDDYWTDPLKLQKQVDFLEANPNYSMCYTDVRYLYQHTGLFDDSISLSQKSDITTADLMQSNRVHTLTALARAELLRKYHSDFLPQMPRFRMGDYPMWLWMSIQAPIYHIKEKCGDYRHLEESASHSKDVYRMYKFYLSFCDIRIYFNKRFKLGCKYLWIYRLKCIVGFAVKNRRYDVLWHDLKIGC